MMITTVIITTIVISIDKVNKKLQVATNKNQGKTEGQNRKNRNNIVKVDFNVDDCISEVYIRLQS